MTNAHKNLFVMKTGNIEYKTHSKKNINGKGKHIPII
jgi:hypothetical protein